MTGFWVLEDSKPSLSSRMVAGRRYAIEEINKVLFPTIAGPRTIGPAVITIPGGRTEPARRLSTTPVEIDVRPLPPGAPTDFSGAVGRFSISARTNGASGAVNEPLTLTVNLTGEGNFDLLPVPGWPDTPGWRTFDAAPKTISRIDDGVLIGRRTYERTLVPREAGDFTIPPVRFTYFDPSKEQLRDHLHRSHTGDGRQGYCRAAPAGRGRGLRRETGHRHPPHQARARIARGRLGPAAREGALLGNGSPSGGRAGGRHRLAQDEGRRQPYQAPATGPIAGRGVCLRTARKAGSDPYVAAGDALSAYIGDKLGQPLSGLTHDALARLLLSRGADPDLVDRVEACLNASEGGRFAPGNEGPESGDELVKETSAVLSELEKQLG